MKLTTCGKCWEECLNIIKELTVLYIEIKDTEAENASMIEIETIENEIT
jgi:hypothetical protein